jgi:hypothetical protein
MYRLLSPVVALVTLAALVVVFAPGAAGQTRTVCPDGGVSNATIDGGLLVRGGNYCVLANDTISGGITILAGGDIELDGSTVYGGINVTPGGEIEVDPGSLFGDNPTTSTIYGGITLNNAFDWDIETANIVGVVYFNGLSAASFPTFCGNTVTGAVRMRNVSPDVTWLGDPVDEFFDCGGNTINGILSISNSSFLEVEGNTVNGSVFLDSSTLELNGNTISGSLVCSSGTVIAPGQPGDPSGNSVGGANGCV